VWTLKAHPALTADSLSLLNYSLDYPWEGGRKYKLTVDSAAITGIYDEHNRPISHEFTVKTAKDYANLYFRIPSPGQPLIVELLNSGDKVVATAPLIDDIATFSFVNPGVYYARAFIDANANGAWDTGNMASRRLPEEVYYFPKRVNVRKNWDIEQAWDIFELPLDQQKPLEIKKNKPVTKEKDSSTVTDGDDTDDTDEFYGNGAQYDNLHRSSSSSSSGNPRLRKASNF
jgi:hypothetical protein